MTAADAATPEPKSAATRADRARDLVALGLVLTGVGLVAGAHVGNTRLATQPIVVAGGHDAFSQWMRYYHMEFTGYGAIVGGIVVGIASYVLHARRARRERRARSSGGAS